MRRWGDLDDRQFPAPHLWWEHCALHTQWGNVLQEGVNADSVGQTKTFFVLCCFSDFFLAVYLFNFLHGRRGLPYLRLFIPANRLVAFCLQVTHPEVTFNSWTENMWSCSMTQTLSLRRLLIQWLQQRCIHGLWWELACRHSEKGTQHTSLHWFESYMTITHVKVSEMYHNQWNKFHLIFTHQLLSVFFFLLLWLKSKHARQSVHTLKHTPEFQKARKSTFTESIIISCIDCHPFPTVKTSFNTNIYCVNQSQQ